MSRAPFQVLVLPYHRDRAGQVRYALFRRQEGYWQGIAGGGEEGESPIQAARRESFEEAGIAADRPFTTLESMTMVPKLHFAELVAWPGGYVIPEYAFAVACEQENIRLSREHSEYSWLGYDDASILLKWDSNRTALWELAERLNHSSL